MRVLKTPVLKPFEGNILKKKNIYYSRRFEVYYAFFQANIFLMLKPLFSMMLFQYIFNTDDKANPN